MGAPLRLWFDVRGGLLEGARACEAEVFQAWYGNTREELDEEYGPYEDHSAFLALADDAGEVYGACRVIVPGGRLKTLDDLARPPWHLDGLRSAAAAGIDPAATWDVGTLGVRPGVGSTAVMAAAALYHGLMSAVLVNGGRTVISIIDERVRGMLHAAGIETHPLPGSSTASYLGSPASTPLYAHMDVVLDHQRRVAPEAYRLITQGIGLDGVLVPPREAFRLDADRSSVVQLPADTTVDVTVDVTETADRTGADAEPRP